MEFITHQLRLTCQNKAAKTRVACDLDHDRTSTTTSVQLTWKLFILKTPWHHHSGMDGATTLDLLIRDSKNKQLNSNNKEASGQSPLSLFAVPGAKNKTSNIEDTKDL